MSTRALVHIVIACLAAPVLALVGIAIGARTASSGASGGTLLFGVPILVGLIAIDLLVTRRWSAIGRGLMQTLLAMIGAIVGVWTGSVAIVLIGACVGAAAATWFTEWTLTRADAGAGPQQP